jgi:hypothetical protein
MPSSPATNPVYANVAFLRIPEFDKRSVAEQASLKDRLEARAKRAIATVALADRVVLDADDGLALVLFGDSARALRIAEAMRGGEEAFLHIGLNYGPLALTSRGPDGRVLGDGLAAAAAAARFATTDRILITHDFVKSLEVRSPELAADLTNAGDFTDTRIRQHSLFTPDFARGAQRRRWLLKTTIGGVVAILLLGVFAREAQRLFFPPSPAVVRLAVKPRGEVFVDGVSQGRTPPMTHVEVPAGKHVVTIRNPGSPPLELSLNLKAGEEMTIRHTFTPPRRTEPKAQQQQQQPQSDFWGDLRKKFGS